MDLHHLRPRSTCKYKNSSRIQMVGPGSPRAFLGALLGYADRRGTHGCRMGRPDCRADRRHFHAETLASDEERALASRKARNHSASLRHNMPFLWHAIADSHFEVLLPHLWCGQDVDAKIAQTLAAASVRRFQPQLLYAPIQDFRHVKFIFGRTCNLVHPSKLSRLLSRFPEHPQHFSIEAQFVNSSRISV